MSDRNRAEGWQHAKLSGHNNEKLIAELTKNSIEIQQRILDCAHMTNEKIIDIKYGGLCEINVDCIIDGGKTKSKTDMWLILESGKKINVSIKKDEGGQVFLIGIDRFINGYEAQYGEKIPSDVVRAIELYFGSADDTLSIIESISGINKALEKRKHRLVADSLKLYNSNLYDKLLSWFNSKIANLFDFCFSRGLSKNKEDWAQIVWYKNMIGENPFDTMIYLPDLLEHIPETAKYGTVNGGSTIQLPFGFVQWHSPRKVIPGNIQFHHSYSKMVDILNSTR
ncbi:MAG: hypothetical protein IKO48_01695 [Elusimicrobia bacterium]|nr:hypothetical protein [Elusimicrobiota bacterium]